MELNKLAKEVHTLAIEKGWWETERSFAEIIALIHSELSEALEEYRNGKPNLYYNCEELSPNYPPAMCNPKDKYECLNFYKKDVCPYKSKKPEGIAVELADVIIRILDYCGKEGIDIDDILRCRRAGNSYYTLPELIAECHSLLSEAYKDSKLKSTKGIVKICFAECINIIMFYCTENGIDIENIILLKHEYNRTRPYRHGGKVI